MGMDRSRSLSEGGSKKKDKARIEGRSEKRNQPKLHLASLRIWIDNPIIWTGQEAWDHDAQGDDDQGLGFRV